MPVVNPGIRRYIGSAIQRLFNSASFSAPLTHSLTLERGTGSPTFTRATTGTVQDNEGILRTAIAGEARFTGARRVENLIRLGAAQSSTLAIGASVTMTLPAGTYIFSQGVSGGTATFSGTGGATGTLAASASVRTSVVKTITAGTLIVTGSVAILTDIHVENITGRTDQTTPSEYVSVGVLSAPYHGAGVDGVKYFDTDLSGNPIAASTLKGYLAEPAATNLCLQSNAFTTTWTETGTVAATQNLTGPDGATSGWTLTDNDAGIPEWVFQTYGALTAANYAQSIFIKKTSGATSFPVIRLNEPITPKEALCTVDTNNGIATVWTAYTGSTIVTSSASCVSYNADWWRVTLVFAGTTASWRVIFYPAATTNATQATGTVSAAVTGTCGVYGSQLELGSSATSYIPTTTVAVARNADLLTYPSAGNIDGTVGWCYAEVTCRTVSNGSPRAIHTGSAATNGIPLYITNTTGKVALYDGTAAREGSALTIPATTPQKIASTWGGSSSIVALNGTATSGAFDGSMDTSIISIGGFSGAPANELGGHIGNVRIGQRQLSSSELQAITR